MTAIAGFYKAPEVKLAVAREPVLALEKLRLKSREVQNAYTKVL